MLALLDQVPGVAESRVDWTGKRFLLELGHGATIDAVVARASAVIGGDAQRVDRSQQAEAIASDRRGETWMRSGESFALSREEARVLAERHAREGAARAGLETGQADQLARMLEQELAAAFAQIHARGVGLPSDFDAIFALAIERTLDRSRAFLDEDEHRRVVELADEFARTH